jgi:hypothetical protein
LHSQRGYDNIKRNNFSNFIIFWQFPSNAQWCCRNHRYVASTTLLDHCRPCAEDSIGWHIGICKTYNMTPLPEVGNSSNCEKLAISSERNGQADIKREYQCPIRWITASRWWSCERECPHINYLSESKTASGWPQLSLGNRLIVFVRRLSRSGILGEHVGEPLWKKLPAVRDFRGPFNSIQILNGIWEWVRVWLTLKCPSNIEYAIQTTPIKLGF